MHNMVCLIGRLTKDVEVSDVSEDKKVATICLAVTRAYKNEDGEYDTDFIDIILWNGIATNTAEYCRKGDLVGIKGRLQQHKYETDDGITYSGIDIIADKITFLSSKKNDE